MPTYTLPWNLAKPLPFDQTDADVWGGYLNDNFDKINALFNRSLKVNVLTKGGNYVVTTADYQTLINANASTASFVITLPTAVGNAGFPIAIKKVDATANTVTIQGNGAELIDGANTFVLSAQYESIMLVSDGSGWNITANKISVASASTTVQGVVELATDAEFNAGSDTTRAVTPSNIANLPFRKAFESAEQAVTQGAYINIAHGLGAIPKLWTCSLRCKTGDLGYSAGDEIMITIPDYQNGNRHGIFVDATNIGLTLQNQGTISVVTKVTGDTTGTITAASWKFVFRAWV